MENVIQAMQQDAAYTRILLVYPNQAAAAGVARLLCKYNSQAARKYATRYAKTIVESHFTRQFWVNFNPLWGKKNAQNWRPKSKWTIGRGVERVGVRQGSEGGPLFI